MATAVQAPALNAGGPTSHTQNQSEGLAKMRVPFPKEQINALPKITCGACSKSPTKECGQHRKSRCRECDNYITTAHMHLDYVGHAELTHRLLDADPLWDWEPVAFGPDGLPVFDRNGGLWIRLTVCGHSRLGYGDAQGKTGPNAVKEAIGDALRNAAMRFGAALDLWAKSDLREAMTEHEETSAPRQDSKEATQKRLDDLRGRIRGAWKDLESLRKVRVLAAEWKILTEQLPDHDGTPVPVSDLLDRRIRALSQTKREQNKQPSAQPGDGAGDDARLHAYLASCGHQPSPDQEHAAAVAELHAAAGQAGMSKEDLEREFHASYGLPIAEASAATIRQMRDILRRSAA